MESSKKFSLSNLLIDILLVLFSIFFISMIGNIFINYYDFIKINYLYYGIILFLFVLIYYFIDKYSEILFKNKIVNVVLLSLYVVFQIWFICNFKVQPSWDFGIVYEEAARFARNESTFNQEVYLYMCDNNIPLAVILGYTFKIFYKLGVSDLLNVGLGLNLICVDVSLLFLYLTLNNIDKKHSKGFFIFCMFVSPFITYLPIFYTDTLTLPFVSFSIYIIYKFFYKKTSIFEIILCGLSLGIGGILKPTVLIILIALIIFMFLKSNKKPKQYALTALLLICLSLLPTIANNIYKKISFDEYRLYENRLIIDHYIMVGLGDEHDGAYSDEYFNFTTNIKGEDQKKIYIDDVIMYRINELKENHGFLEFYNRKNSFTWTNGSFYAPQCLNSNADNQFLKYIYSDNGSDNLYWAICNVQWSLILALMVIGCSLKKYLSKDMFEFKVLLDIATFGLILFLCMWEASSRYVINFLPIFLIDAFIGINGIRNFLDSKSK